MITAILYFVLYAIISLIVGLIIYARWNYGSLEKTNIPVIKPHLFLGSFPDAHKVVFHEDDLRNAKKYGKVWGAYEGRAPHVYITDPDLVKLICVKDFDTFHDRRQLDFGHELINEMLDVLPGEKWKTVRAALTPAFTTGKIRVMSEQMKEAVQDCVNHVGGLLEGADSKVINIKEVYVALTTDVFARCAFGTKLNSVNDPDNVFIRFVKKLTLESDDPNFLMSYVAAFPFLAKGIPFIPGEVMDFFNGVLGDILKNRREQKITQNDLVDFFNELIERVPTEEFKRLGITEKTVMSQAILFLLAGFDTTATTLTMLSYQLARNPDKQKKLTEELDTVYEKTGGKLTHDALVDLPYLNACINETLRLCPPLIRIERSCLKDWTHPESGLVIKKGTTVQISTWAIHRNKQYYENPDDFIPERFLSNKRHESATNLGLHPYGFMSFGQGNRQCPGSRFAKEEINLAMAMILKDYQFAAVPETKLQFKNGRAFLVQYHPIQLKLTRRQR